MREGSRALGLALLLWAHAAGANEPPPVTEITPAVATPLGAGDSDEAVAREPGPLGYRVVQGNLETSADGGLRFSAMNGTLSPSRGYYPVEVMLHNEGSTPRVVRVSVEARGSGGGLTTRQVEVGARQRVPVSLPVSVQASNVMVRADSPGLNLRPISFYAVQTTRPVLVLGSERAFQEGTRLPERERDPDFSVRFLSAEEAPRELAPYVGHVMVVVAGEVAALPAETWSALEAYASTGGLLVLLRPPRDVLQRLPLLPEPGEGYFRYGFGQVRLCGDPADCGTRLLSDVSLTDQDRTRAVLPAGSAPSWQRRYALYNDTPPLLPGVQAPVGRFLLLITLFVLAVGPGGLLLARRKGPVALLIAVPSVALATCLGLVAWSVLVEGFSLHAARQSLTWLDRERDRAMTLGVSGYYANLAPDGVQVPALGALVSADVTWDQVELEADWTQGMRVTGGFLSARTYREWGELAARPTRARLALRSDASGSRVQNALGAPLADGFLFWKGTLWRLPALAEGGEGALSPVTGLEPREAASHFLKVQGSVDQRRFGVAAWDAFGAALPEGGFIARLTGEGLGAVTPLPVKLYQGAHLVRGGVDAP